MSNRDSKGYGPDRDSNSDRSGDIDRLDDNNGNPMLDLGLDSLLNSKKDEEFLPASEANSQVDSKSASLVTESNPKPEVILSEFEELAKQQSWSEILSKCELVLETQQVKIESPEKWLEAQCWWIISQVELKSLPAAVLSAPLEAMLDYLLVPSAVNSSADPVEIAKSREIVKQAGAKLSDRLFAQAEMLSGMQLLSRTRVLGGDLSILKNCVLKYTQPLAALSGSDHRFYLILCKELGIDAGHASGQISNQAQKDGWTDSLDTKSNSFGTLVPKPKTRTSNSFLRLTSLIFLAIVMVVLGSWYIWNTKNKNANFPLQLSKVEPAPANMEYPQPAALNKVSELDAVLYKLESQGKNQANSENLNANVSPTAVPSAPKEVATPRVRVPIDTKGPLESNDVRDLRHKNAGKKSTDTHPREVIVPGPAQAPRFEAFPSPRIFEVNRATNLMLKPSLSSDAVAGLNQGDRIKVVGISGYWLKILSRQGKVAYVLAEDAEPR